MDSSAAFPAILNPSHQPEPRQSFNEISRMNQITQVSSLNQTLGLWGKQENFQLRFSLMDDGGPEFSSFSLNLAPFVLAIEALYV
mmetsp:Transcript_20134/g.49398  ORF Transcript_20134/g.49398 Transcript_20134/m.49398 type:complete len:85 (+) Transcript_20134:228-482(+)